MRYLKPENVLSRLSGKVRITDDPEAEPDRMPTALFCQLCVEAETTVEMDLSERYLTPFMNSDGRGFTTIQEHPTRSTLLNMMTTQAMIRVLETDFGAGTVANAESFIKRLQERYTQTIDKLTERRPKETYGWRRPPLPTLALSEQNSLADTGYRGTVHVINGAGADGGYPAAQINDPSETLWNGTLDDL